MKSLILICLSLILSGCALTDYASKFLGEMRDTNQYEQARDTANNVCDQATLDRLDTFLGADTTAVIKKKCDEKRTAPQPLN